jgi:hypothetical protein
VLGHEPLGQAEHLLTRPGCASVHHCATRLSRGNVPRECAGSKNCSSCKINGHFMALPGTVHNITTSRHNTSRVTTHLAPRPHSKNTFLRIMLWFLRRHHNHATNGKGKHQRTSFPSSSTHTAHRRAWWQQHFGHSKAKTKTKNAQENYPTTATKIMGSFVTGRSKNSAGTCSVCVCVCVLYFCPHTICPRHCKSFSLSRACTRPCFSTITIDATGQ